MSTSVAVSSEPIVELVADCSVLAEVDTRLAFGRGFVRRVIGSSVMMRGFGCESGATSMSS